MCKSLLFQGLPQWCVTYDNTHSLHSVKLIIGKIVNVDEWNAGLTHPALLTASKQLEGAGTADSFYLLDMVSAKVLDNMNKGIQEMIQGNKTPQEVMDNVQATWEEENSQK